MARSVLTLAKKAVLAKGISAPVSLISSEDFAQQLLNIAEETAVDLVSRPVDWQELVMEGTFVTVAAEEQITIKTTFPYLRKIINDTMFNRTLNKRLTIVSAQKWQSMKSEGFTASQNIYRIRGGVLLMPDTVEAGSTVAFEYIDSRPFSSSDGSELRVGIEADTDLCRLNEDLLMLGIRWRFLAEKGLEYGETFRLYEDKIAEAIGSNKPAEILNLSRSARRSDGFGDPSIPDSDFPSS